MMSFRKVFRQHKDRGKGLFYTSVFIAIVAFYTLLSLSEQEAVRFLRNFESDALQKLLMLAIPLLYGLSLFFVFALIYFAFHYLLGRRRQAFGLFLMLGISRGRLFLSILRESLRDSLFSLFLGLPFAVFFCESISLLSSKALGLSLQQYRSSFSLRALLITGAAAILLQLLASIVVSLQLCLKEPQQLLYPERRKEQTLLSGKMRLGCFITGCAFLALAYALGIEYMLPCVLFGMLGTFLLFKGLGAMVAAFLNKNRARASGLSIFKLRQIQELLLARYRLLTLCSLLLAVSMSCFAFGIGVIAESRSQEPRSVDASLNGPEDEIRKFLQAPQLGRELQAAYPMHLDYGKEEQDITPLLSSLQNLKQTTAVRLTQMLDQAMSGSRSYLIPFSSMAALYAAQGTELAPLNDHQIYFYSSFFPELPAKLDPLLSELSSEQRQVRMGDRNFELLPRLLDKNIVADRKISVFLAWVVPDSVYAAQVRDTEAFCWNLHLKDGVLREKGLVPALIELDNSLRESGLSYESYLSGVGRKLFYTITASYLNGYLGLLFLLIGNGLLVLQILIHQEESRERYRRLLRLGVEKEKLLQAARSQSSLSFFLVFAVACLNSFFACVSMFRTFTPLSPENRGLAYLLALAVGLLFLISEILYIVTIRKGTEQRLLALSGEGGREGSL